MPKSTATISSGRSPMVGQASYSIEVARLLGQTKGRLCSQRSLQGNSFDQAEGHKSQAGPHKDWSHGGAIIYRGPRTPQFSQNIVCFSAIDTTMQLARESIERAWSCSMHCDQAETHVPRFGVAHTCRKRRGVHGAWNTDWTST